MITKSNLKDMLTAIGYVMSAKRDIYEKSYPHFDCMMQVDFNGSGSIIYPEEKGIKITRKTTCNFSQPENFVVLECVTRLLDKGYRPEHIELEKEWSLGHTSKGGYADILVKDSNGKTLFIVECKTAGNEYKKELSNMLNDGGQLFSYWQQERSCRWLVLYTSDLKNMTVEYFTDSINCSDDANIIASSKKDSSILLYKDAKDVSDLFRVWDETYDKRLCGDVIFRNDSTAYQIGVKPLRKVDLRDFSENDRIVNKFEEILRHNNVSDKENAFNRLIALFICKLVDEIQKGDNDILEFQYMVGTDTYETLQDRLQRLHKDGMEKFMREKIFYVSDSYAEDLVQQYTGYKRQKMIEDLKKTLRILKFYTNNDFTFKDVHNEELFYQNGKILVEVVQLFEKFRIIGSSDLQMLGDLFEQLLNKGFKQNEGQFFTPAPICRFVWDSIPIERIIKQANGIEYPKIIDYACGAGHFLTQGFEAINANIQSIDPTTIINRSWAEHKIFGIEKDYRLARVSKISLFMHGAGDGNIIFGDGLENYPDKEISPESFDILVANPPYAVKAFKPHLKLSDNTFTIINKISNDGSEIETLFVERITQLVKPGGIAAVILPSSILSKETESFISARESILQNFQIKAIAQFGSKTFGATGTNTVIVFLEKYHEPPKRLSLVSDSVNAIFDGCDLKDWEEYDILNGYLQKINIDQADYFTFVNKSKNYIDWKDHVYFGAFYKAFVEGSEYVTKVKQKSFQNLPYEDKLSWFNQHFYDFASAIEKEKLLYFALVYQQTTLVITSPDDYKEQEKFLGYKWSNRKGQEGIQIITPGGMLYDEDDRTAKDKLSGLIRNMFYSKEYSITGMEEYFYYLRLQDMIDFGSFIFNKAIKTAKTQPLKMTPGLINYKLSDNKIFELSIGNRVLSNEVVENGSIPIYSANVFEEFGKIDKLNLTDFSVPSILWGIDGDWMVNMIPAGQPFYPTDHCGVLRVHSDDIVPRYLAVALQVAGEFEKFSRSNRASTQRIKSLTIQIPELKSVQQQIIDELESVDAKIDSKKKAISIIVEDIEKKYNYLFNNSNIPEIAIGLIAPFETSKIPVESIDKSDYVTTDNMLQQKRGIVPYTEGIDKITNVTKYSVGDILVSNIRPYLKKIWLANKNAGCSHDVLVFHIKDQTSMLPEYVYYSLYQDSFFEYMMAGKTGMKMPRGDKKTIPLYKIKQPNISLQTEFVNFLKEKQLEQSMLEKDINNLNTQKDFLINKYFR